MDTHLEKIAELEARADSRDERIDQIIAHQDRMEDKIDRLTQAVNDLKYSSVRDDSDIDKRVTAIETELMLQKQTTKNNYTRLSLFIAILTILFTAATFYFNFMIK